MGRYQTATTEVPHITTLLRRDARSAIEKIDAASKELGGLWEIIELIEARPGDSQSAELMQAIRNSVGKLGISLARHNLSQMSTDELIARTRMQEAMLKFVMGDYAASTQMLVERARLEGEFGDRRLQQAATHHATNLIYGPAVD